MKNDSEIVLLIFGVEKDKMPAAAKLLNKNWNAVIAFGNVFNGRKEDYFFPLFYFYF